ncbi:MAG TPA: RNA 2',3'-cyclic phosphodiesterase [Kouleothrix sp.]|uniref:RNA 2',3'-cyclic phosphodiesterase n=1 Tax=Kouleothrix sp. TaxID=2779161 RepID=UPI002CD481F5|nr:RNA 2',3'-cyclic phosphodiesterase [Kouleothrix sp.]HRC77145.1 RNA 2',3'-cyclic phosphodiesterase [Kouleothrix sp.]
MSYRLFIATPLPPAVKAALAAAQTRLGRGGAPIKWVAPSSMHLTLRFLGETDTTLLPTIGPTIRQSIQGYPAFQLSLTHVSAFPNTRHPNVVWAGVGGAVEALGRLAGEIERAMVAIGFQPEKRAFRPHLTLGRARHGAAQTALERLGDTIRALPQLPPVAWLAQHVSLLRSELQPGGPIYTEIADCQLAGDPQSDITLA